MNNNVQGIDHVIRKMAHIFPNENVKKSFRELHRKWHTERSRRNFWGRTCAGRGALGGMRGQGFGARNYQHEQPTGNLTDDRENTLIEEDEETGGNNQPVLNQQSQPEEEKIMLTSSEKQAIVKTIAELLKVNSHRNVLEMVMEEDWTNGSTLHVIL